MKIIDEFLELVKISSPSGGERAMTDVLTKKLKELELTVSEDDTGAKIGGNAGNLYAFLPASKGFEDAEPVLFSGHMDRVPDGDGIVPVFTEDGRIVTDGSTILAADDLAGVCAILDGLRRVKDSGKPHGPVEVLLTVSEELSLRGSRNADYSKIRSKHGYCMDSSGRIGRVITGAPAIDRLFVTVHGKSSHAGASPEKGIDAIKAAAKFLAGVREGRLDEESTSNFGIVRAGSATNVICELAEITGEARSHKIDKLHAYEKYVGGFLKESMAGTGATAEYRIEENHGAFVVPFENMTVTKAEEALRLIGVTPNSEIGGGGMDANIMNDHGIYAVGVATGYMKNHTHQEELYADDMAKAGELVEQLIYVWSKEKR